LNARERAIDLGSEADENFPNTFALACVCARFYTRTGEAILITSREEWTGERIHMT